MKTNVDGISPGGGPWPADAHQEVPQLRRAITTHLDEPMIAGPMAPMMGELLSRLEGFSDPPRVAALEAPIPPGGEGSISGSDAVAALHQACGTLRERVLSGGDDPGMSQTLQAMVEVIEDHVAMKGEILARCASDGTPG